MEQYRIIVNIYEFILYKNSIYGCLLKTLSYKESNIALRSKVDETPLHLTGKELKLVL